MKTTFATAVAFAVAAIVLTVFGQNEAAVGAWWAAGAVGIVSLMWLIARSIEGD